MDPMPHGSLEGARYALKEEVDFLRPVELKKVPSPPQASESSSASGKNSNRASNSEIECDIKWPPPPLLALPLEIRRQIWIEVLGGTAYHLGFRGEPVIRGWLCLSEETCSCDGFDCYNLRMQVKSANRRSLLILLTCRQM